MLVSFLIEAMVKPSSLQAFAHRPALVRSKCGFENRIKNTFFIRSVSAYRELLIAAVLVVTIVQHRTSVLDKTACVCSKTSRVDHTKSVHNRPKPAVFVRTAQGLSSNQNEDAINSKSGLWRTALLAAVSWFWAGDNTDKGWPLCPLPNQCKACLGDHMYTCTHVQIDIILKKSIP